MTGDHVGIIFGDLSSPLQLIHSDRDRGSCVDGVVTDCIDIRICMHGLCMCDIITYCMIVCVRDFLSAHA